MTGWITRSELADVAPPAGLDGLLLTSPIGEVIAPLGVDDLPTALEISRGSLQQAGLTDADRVVVALNNDGDLGGTLLALAAAGVCAAAAAPGPRGRMRLLQVLRAIRATTLVITPTGAMDLLARLHLEFLVDPLDLGLRRIVLVGEIADPRTRGHLAAEFEAEVTDVYCDPVLGLALAAGADGLLTPARDGLLELAPISKDELLRAPYPAGYAELVLTPSWHPQLAGVTIRTGHVVALDAEANTPRLPVPRHTIGEHVLVRGRWLSVPQLSRALSRIDGIASWQLVIERPGTLDTATVRVTFNRPSLTANPMWRGRLTQTVAAVTPVALSVEINDEVSDEVRPPVVIDQRGQHLAVDRAEVG